MNAFSKIPLIPEICPSVVLNGIQSSKPPLEQTMKWNSNNIKAFQKHWWCSLYLSLSLSIVTEDKSSDQWLLALRNSDMFLDNWVLPITVLLMWWNIHVPCFPLPQGILAKCHMHFSPTLRKQSLHINSFFKRGVNVIRREYWLFVYKLLQQAHINNTGKCNAPLIINSATLCL